jgi:hypothetical protein
MQEIMDRDAFAGYLNALASEIPREKFRCAGRVNRVTYVIRYIGDGQFSYRNRDITKGRVLYVGRGHAHRATKQFKFRGKVTGQFARDFDDFIFNQWPNFEAFFAAWTVNEAVAAALEYILYKHFDPPYMDEPKGVKSSPGDIDTSSLMQPAKFINHKFDELPPRHTHVSIWDELKQIIIPDDAILTRVSERQKNNTVAKDQAHYDSYPPLGGNTSFASHLKKNRNNEDPALDLKLGEILKHVWWDATYPHSDGGPIIEITWPRGAGEPPVVVHPHDGPVFVVG